MTSKKVSADRGVADGLTIVSYIAGNDGSQKLVSCPVWDPVNIVNRQAWLEIESRVEISKRKIAAGKVSCLHYYMTANQMNSGLLAEYTGLARWRVRLHIIPFFFDRLGADILDRYAEVFKVSAADLIHGRLSSPVYDNREYEINNID